MQLFDSWAGALTPGDYRRSVMPHSASVLAAVADLGVPRIHFGVGTGSLLPLMAEAGADVVGVDWRTPLAEAIPRVGDRAVQGNLDPTLLFAPPEVMTARAGEIIEAGRAAQGPRVQPRPRRAAVHRPGPAEAPDGVRAGLLSGALAGLDGRRGLDLLGRGRDQLLDLPTPRRAAGEQTVGAEDHRARHGPHPEPLARLALGVAQQVAGEVRADGRGLLPTRTA